jgi:ribosomal protein L11 methyltransferase
MTDEYRRFWLTSRAAIERERLLAEAFEAGAEGAEESEEPVEGVLRFRACVYAPAARVEAVREALQGVAAADTRIEASEAMPQVDWSEAWKEGIEALRISSRLLVRPPFVDVALEPGQSEVVIDPGQAFGTGGHASTRLCLEWIDALYAAPEDRRRFDRVLDAGTGSGVLAFAALVLGARRAVGFDLDPVAIEAARASAASNGLSDRVELLAVGIDALDDAQDDTQDNTPDNTPDNARADAVAPEFPTTYPLVVANLLKREVLPIATALAARLEAGGCLVLSGLLEEDGPEVLERFGREGLVESRPRREVDDATGTWIGLCLERSVG